MILQKIDILNFKNIRASAIEFSPGANCLLGLNGMGKSNLLDAIHFLCMTKPMASVPEASLVTHGEEMLLVKGDFVSDTGASDSISCGFTRKKGKSLKRNGKSYGRIAEHIGRYPVVTASPADAQLASGPAEERRKLMDIVISQARPDYLSSLIRYNRALESRNRMLRAGVRDSLLFDSVEAGMEEAAATVVDCRREWVESIAPKVAQCYGRVSGADEKVEVSYRSQLKGTTLSALLAERRQKDTLLGFTSAGPHRDDLEASLDGYSLRRLGSQGQLKTFTVALRLAIFDFLHSASGIMPILLLDDIFDKLDSQRVANIMHEVTEQGKFGQIFITDTNRKHLDDIISSLHGPKMLLNVENGNFTPITA